MSQNCGVKSIETVWASHELAPGGYTILIHDNADMNASMVDSATQASAHDCRKATKKSKKWKWNSDPNHAYLAALTLWDPSRGFTGKFY